jgi:hypothetical protein
MTTESKNAVEIQRKYYADTVAQYEEINCTEGSAYPLRMDFVIAMLRRLRFERFLTWVPHQDAPCAPFRQRFLTFCLRN